MAGAQSLLSYVDVKEVLDKALESERGLLLKFVDVKAAVRFRYRANNFRSLDRVENKKIYTEETHTLHGRSAYDTLSLTIEGSRIFVRKIVIDFEIEELPE